MAAACDGAESVNLDLETNFGDCEDELDLEGFELPSDDDYDDDDDADSGEFEQEAIRDSDYDSIDDFGSDSDDADDADDADDGS
jgi:hypothetical protein